MFDAGSSHGILVIDDTEANRYTVSRILRQHGFAVREAATGHEGLAAVAQGADLVVLDIRLPDIDGFEICHRIKADPATRDIPVLHISASFTGTDAKVRGLEGGADGYLAHPVEPAELVATVRALLRARDAEASARAAATQWKLTFDSIADPVCLTGFDGAVVRCNRAFAELVHADFRDVIGRPLGELLPEVASAAAEASSHPCELAVGSRWFRLGVSRAAPRNGGSGSVAWVFSDITGNKLAEAELLASREQLRFVTDAAPVFIAHCDTAGHYRFVNRAYAERLGKSVEQVVGKHIADVVGAKGYQELRPYLERVFGGEAVEFELEITYPVLGDRVMHCAYVPELGPAGRVQGLLAVITDVTERRRGEEALRHTQKLESIGVLAGGIAHDFNNLLTAILGNASLALRTLPPAHPAAPLMQDVVRGSERAAALTAQLLAYAGKGRLFVERLDLARLIREIAELMRSLIPRNVEVVLEFEEPLGTVLADAGQLQQVIMNLVINAGEAIGERPGTVWVSARGADVDAVELRERFGMFDIPPGRYVRLEVRDDGSGMTEETRAQVFEPFFTTKFLGRGLGLAATLGVVRSHHGGIDVQSVPGRGTTVTVILPQAELALADAPAPPARRAANRAPGGTVLVADDEELVRRAARNALAREGYTVLEAATGLEAVDVFRRHADGIAVVLLDMTMPHMSGDEAAQHILRQRPDVPIVATSGYGEMEALRRFTGSRVAAFLQKPYNDAQLVELVASVLARTGLPGGGGPV